MLLLSRRRCRQVISLLLGAWFFAVAVSLANACEVHALHRTTDDGMSMSHGHAGDGGVPSDCERFCNDDTPLPTKVPSFGDASDGIDAIIASIAPVIRVVAHLDTPCDLNTVACRVVYSVLLQSQRLAL